MLNIYLLNLPLHLNFLNKDYNPNASARFGNSTQPGGTNYKEYVLSLPPKNKSQTYQSGEDFQYKTHFPEYNPVFHIRTKDRTTPDGKLNTYSL